MEYLNDQNKCIGITAVSREDHTLRMILYCWTFISSLSHLWWVLDSIVVLFVVWILTGHIRLCVPISLECQIKAFSGVKFWHTGPDMWENEVYWCRHKFRWVQPSTHITIFIDVSFLTLFSFRIWHHWTPYKNEYRNELLEVDLSFQTSAYDILLCI